MGLIPTLVFVGAFLALVFGIYAETGKATGRKKMTALSIAVVGLLVSAFSVGYMLFMH